jgi:hypothetical protein
MKRFALPLIFILVLGACASRRAEAQIYNIPQSASQVGTLACGGTATVQNVGQSTHILNYQIVLGTATTGTASVQGSNDGVIFNTISDSGQSLNGAVVGFGYWTVMRLQLDCQGGIGAAAGDMNYQYSGTSAPAERFGAALESATRKLLGLSVPAGVSKSMFVVPPYGSTQGSLVFSYIGGAGPSGSTLAVKLVDGTVVFNRTIATFTLGTSNSAPQVFLIPHVPAAVNAADAQMQVEIDYATGGANANTFALAYYFDAPGYQQPGFGFSYTNVSTDTNTVIKAGTGQLRSIVINKKGTTSTATVYDGATCAGTKIATIDTSGGTASLLFDVQFSTGLCITTASAGAADLTVSWR